MLVNYSVVLMFCLHLLFLPYCVSTWYVVSVMLACQTNGSHYLSAEWISLIYQQNGYLWISVVPLVFSGYPPSTVVHAATPLYRLDSLLQHVYSHYPLDPVCTKHTLISHLCGVYICIYAFVSNLLGVHVINATHMFCDKNSVLLSRCLVSWFWICVSNLEI